MTKKHFIALADFIKDHNRTAGSDRQKFTEHQIAMLSTFCDSQNPRFDRERWIDYINDSCGKNDGKVKA